MISGQHLTLFSLWSIGADTTDPLVYHPWDKVGDLPFDYVLYKGKDTGKDKNMFFLIGPICDCLRGAHLGRYKHRHSCTSRPSELYIGNDELLEVLDFMSEIEDQDDITIKAT